MKTIALGLQKGGVGKTSISLALSTELANAGYNVLLVDCDPQGNSTSALLKEIPYEFADVLFGTATIEEACCQTEVENLYILPTAPIGTRLREYKGSQKVITDTFEIDDQLKKVSENFDYCILDTSPDFTIFEMNCYMACNEIIPVMNCDTFASDGLTIFLENIKQFCAKKRVSTLEIKTIVMNRYNASMALDTEIKKIIEESSNLNKITIPQDQAFKKAQNLQKTVQEITKNQSTKDSIKALMEFVL